MSILGALLQKYPVLLSAEDYQPLLKLLKDFQETIKYPIEMRTFIDICTVMLSKEAEIMSSSTILSETFCNEQWIAISQLACRNSGTNSTITGDNIKLLRLLIEYKKYESLLFIGTIVDAVLLNSIKRSNETLQLLATIFRNVNIDLLHNGKELRLNTIQWVNPKLKPAEFLKQMVNVGKIDVKLTGELYALCVLSKLDQLKQCPSTETVESIDTNDEFTRFIRELETNLQYRKLSKLVVFNSREEKEQRERKPSNGVVASDVLKTMIIETDYEELRKALNPGNSNPEGFTLTQDVDQDLKQVATSLGIHLQILQQLLNYESMDADRFNTSFLKKQIQMKVGQMNVAMRALISANQEAKEIFDAAEHLLSIFHNDLSPAVNKILFVDQGNESIIRWCIEKLQTVEPGDSQNDSTVIMYETELSFERRVHVKCFLALAHLAADSGANGIAAFDHIMNFGFDYECQLDTFLLLAVMKVCVVHDESIVVYSIGYFCILQVIIRQEPTETKGKWIISEIKSCLRYHHKEPENRQKIVDLLPYFFKFVKPCADALDEVGLIITQFLKLADRKTCDPKMVIQLIRSIKYFARVRYYNPHLPIRNGR